MSDLGWMADGIERAEACGGVVLETYRRPGFTGQRAVRRSDGSGAGGGIPLSSDPWWDWEQENRASRPTDAARRQR